MSARGHRQTIAAAIATLAAAVSLYPLFLGATWFWAGAGATGTVAVAGTLTRLRRLPLLVCITVGILGLVWYLNIAFEAGQSLGHVLPTVSSLEHLGQLARSGVDESSKYAPPAPQLPGILLLGTGGIGIVALLVDFTAVRLRSAALAGAPLLLLITEPFAVSAARGWAETVLAFCLGSAGYLGMLSTESRERIREWEQPRPGSEGDSPDMSTLSSAGRRVGAAALVIALCLPVFIPGLHVTRLLGGQPGIGGNPGDGSGVGYVAGFPSPEAAMSTQLQGANLPVLTYHATAVPTAPGSSTAASTPTSEYLQLYVLDQFTTSGFQFAANGPVTPLSRTGGLPTAPGLPASPGETDWPLVSTSVQVNNGISTDYRLNGQNAAILPVPYPALGVETHSGTWLTRPGDLMVYSDDTQVAGLSYQTISLQPTPTEQALAGAGPPPADITGAYLSVPQPYKVLASLTQGLTAGATTEIAKADDIQEWLNSTGGFTYTLKAPAVTNAASLATFLENTRRGYCQQFAVAMAVLARLAGIPSRVVVGYTSGTQEKGGAWLVRTHDAHEWPELYFAGYGWLRFEPTPAGENGAGTAVAPAYSKLPATTGPGTPGIEPGLSGSSATPHPSSSPANQHARLPFGNEGGLGGSLPTRTGGLTAWQIFGLVLAGLLAVAVITPSVARLAIRRRRWGRARRGGDAALAHAAWRELQDDLIDYQAGYAPSESPRAIGTRLGTERQLASAGVEALSRIAIAEERALYAARPVPGEHLRADSTELRRALAATTSRSGRLRARLLPPSVLRYPRELLARGVTRELAALPAPAPALLKSLHHGGAPHGALSGVAPLAVSGLRTSDPQGHAGHVPPATQPPDAAQQHDNESANG
jgi:transglutaminase-like putative cysteine protease